MSGTFNPDTGAQPQAPWNVTFLSQRDVALSIPINYVTAPGVSLTAACFADQNYEDDLFTRCLSNLLVTGFRRIVVDIYWDVHRRVWSFCPVQIPVPGTQPQPESSTTTPSGISKVITSSPAAYVPPTATTTNPPVVRQEQQLQSQSSETSTVTPLSGNDVTVTVEILTSSNTTQLLLPTTPVPEAGNGLVYAIGPYTCSPTLGLDVLIDVMSDFMRETDDTLAAVLKYITFNVHAAAPSKSPTGPAQKPDDDDLPATPQLIGNLFQSKLSSYLYTSSQLQLDRQNIRNTWENVRNQTAPDPSYYTTTDNGLETPDGWPNEEYLEFEKVQRLLIGFQSISPQMSNYDLDGDSSIMFATGTLVDEVNTTLSADGSVVKGCFFKSDETSLSATNDSWAVSDDTVANANFNAANLDADRDLLPEVNGLVTCGISPILNVSLANSTADAAYAAYADFVRSNVWSWAPGEPKSSSSTSSSGNSTSSSSSNDDDLLRCAVFDAFSTPVGRWHARYCHERYRAACRANGRPHVWQISPDAGFYSQISNNCPADYSFAVPRTALENRYLLQACWDAGIGSPPGSSSGSGSGTGSDFSDGELAGAIWLNFNSLQTEDCWVIGVNTTCPYTPSGSDTREILVPTIAAIVILVLALSMVLVKCGANRRKERKKTRVLNGWDYEGVPS